MTTNLNQQIQQFYDASSRLWEQIWGEHMHHGFYGRDGREKKDRRQAQVDLIVQFLNWGEVDAIADRATILDVGCGIGGSSLYLAQQFNAQVTGITLSPVQAARATARSQAASLGDRTHFQVADAQAMPFADNSFDLVWSLESGEHMPDKVKFLQECYRVLKPGGKLLFATWCHRPTHRGSRSLNTNEIKHLEQIYEVYCLPYVISLPEYKAIAHNIGFNVTKTADWSTAVAPFWDEVITSAFTLEAIFGLLTSGWTTIRAALSMGLMRSGYQTGLVRFGLLCGVK
ncbi:methyltransferase domain-containing protein [Merismopedia glauca]|uniref:SAM-dependent methyltransferase n=1 Tax=Merismopedia glauca CCAP 1448/3 TaxID=1296344 RepID=A0A2T1C6A8_9CYAN|nr:methyltransferase domain-containing protein [Merismopedia glauca]PSB03789.1 SAM-dependent methyltransferase [Merismopedia glauca CCAP 1448/3]